MRRKEKIVEKKPHRMALSLMSEHWSGNPPKKSGKHNSNEMQARNQKRRKAIKNKKAKS